MMMTERQALAGRGKRLEYFTIAWNSLEGLIAVSAGALAGSISLVGFGVDSFIEVTSGSALLWRLSVDSDVHRREHFERRTLRIVGACFLALGRLCRKLLLRPLRPIRDACNSLYSMLTQPHGQIASHWLVVE
jgi:hypothetical protein